MKVFRPYLLILLFLSGCYFPLNDPEYLSEQEQILNSVLDETILVSGMTSAFYIENDKWPQSSNELEKFLSKKVFQENYDQELIRKCKVFLWKYKDLKLKNISGEKLKADYKHEDNIDVSISLLLKKAVMGEKYDYELNLSFETYQVEGSINEFEVTNKQNVSSKDELISELVFGIILGLLEALSQQ
jgi:hypothetical protein